MTLRDKVLARIRAERERADKATPGPWTVDAAEPWDVVIWGPAPADTLVFNVGENPAPIRIGEPASENELGDAHFIASARTLLPALLAEAERQVEEHEPGIMRDAGVCCGCADPTRPDDCPVILGWARVFRIGEAADAK